MRSGPTKTALVTSTIGIDIGVIDLARRPQGWHDALLRGSTRAQRG